MSINWNKPLYDEEGREYTLMRNADGTPIRTQTEGQYWVHHGGWIYRCTPSGGVRPNGMSLSNSAKVNYRNKVESFEELADKKIDIYFGKKDGEWFAEVVPK